MKKQKAHGTKNLPGQVMVVMTALLLAAGLMFASGTKVLAEEISVQTETDETVQEEKQLVISVVEDMEAVEIEENEVPLAAFPDTANRNGTRHVVLMGIMLLCLIAYVLYFGRYEKKLLLLRHKAASVEYQMMRMRRNNRGKEDMRMQR